MEKVVTKVGVLHRVELAKVKDQAISLWEKSFVEDNHAFAKAYFHDYIDFVDSNFFVDDKGTLVLMAFNTIEAYQNEKATLIEGIAVDPRFQKQGIMAAFMDEWMKELSQKYVYVFIQAYNWHIYKRYDFLPFNRNNLWSFKPYEAHATLLAEPGYNNRPLTDMQRTDKHLAAYFASMSKGGSSLLSHLSASLVLSDTMASNVAFSDHKHLLDLLQSIGTELTFLLPNDIVLHDPRLTLVEHDRLETKLYQKELTGRFNFIF